MPTIAGRLRMANRIATRFAPRVAQLFDLGGFSVGNISAGQLGQGRAAEAMRGGGITFDRDWLLGTSKADLRGNIIHELTHVAGVGHGKSEKRVETLADFARYTLNPQEAPGWNPSQAVMNMANRYNAGRNPGGRPSTTGRMRQSLTNYASKSGPGGPVPPPALSPSQANALAQRSAQNELNLAQVLAQNRAAAGQIRAQFRASKDAANVERIAGQAANVNANLEQGGGGISSFSLEQRSRTDAARDAQIQAAIQERMQGRLGLRTDRLNAINQFYTEQYAIQADRAAMQQEAAAQAFLNDMVMRMNDEGYSGRIGATGGAFGGRGGGGRGAAQTGDEGGPAPAYDDYVLSGRGHAGTRPPVRVDPNGPMPRTRQEIEAWIRARLRGGRM